MTQDHKLIDKHAKTLQNVNFNLGHVVEQQRHMLRHNIEQVGFPFQHHADIS